MTVEKKSVQIDEIKLVKIIKISTKLIYLYYSFCFEGWAVCMHKKIFIRAIETRKLFILQPTIAIKVSLVKLRNTKVSRGKENTNQKFFKSNFHYQPSRRKFVKQITYN